jgi:hypothetical protein
VTTAQNLPQEHRQYLAELATATDSTEESLIEGGYHLSIPNYIENGKTVHQVAGTIMSARRFSRERSNHG